MPLAHLLLDLLLATMVAGDPDAPAAEPATRSSAARQVTVTVVGEPHESESVPAGKAMRFRIVGTGDAGAVAAPPGEKRKVAFLGVGTSPLAPAVRAQTTLGEDMGLSIDSISPGSPAEAAGLKRFDILARYDDQLLCATQQLAALVKRTGTGNKAQLTVIRGGKEMPVEITVGEHEVTATMTLAVMSVDGPGTLLATPQAAGQAPKPLIVVKPETRSSSRASSSFSDDQGHVIVTESDGVRTVTILDATGKQQHAGPLDDDLESIPEPLRDRVRRVMAAGSGPPAPSR